MGSNWILTTVFVWSKTDSNFFFVEHHLFASQSSQIVNAGEFDRIDRTCLFAHPAINASQFVENEGRRVFVPVFPMWIIFGAGAAMISMQLAGHAVWHM